MRDHKDDRGGLRILFISLVVFLFQNGTVLADDRWLRVVTDKNSSHIDLPAEAIDYGRFIWLPENVASNWLTRQHNPQIQRFENPFEMTIGRYRIDPINGFHDDNGFPEDDEGWFTESVHTGPDFQLIQFRGPIKSSWIQNLKSTGIEPIQYLHPYSYIVWGDNQQLDASRSLPEVRWGGRLMPAMRVAPQVLHNGRTDHPHHMALVYRGHVESVVYALKLAGAEVVSVAPLNRQLSLLELRIPPNQYQSLASIAGILTLQPIAQDVALTSEMTGQSIVGGYDASNITFPGYPAWLSRLGLDGAGTIVSVVDSGFSLTHHDLVGQYLPCLGTQGSCNQAAYDAIFHGTFSAGIVAGSGATGALHGDASVHGGQFLSGLGIAPGASMIFQTFNPFINQVGSPGNGPGGMVPNGMLSIFRDSIDSGAVIATNSWVPTGNPQGYDILSRQLDMVTRDANPELPGHQPLLLVQATPNGQGDGNFGAPGCELSSLGGSNEAKNHLLVGSSNLLMSSTGIQRSDIFSISSNSAHGPACDGRIAPQIIAPGCHLVVLNSAGDTWHGQNCGTSIATPVIAGAAALFFQHYRNRYGTDPNPAMVKAALLAVTRNLAGNIDADGGILGHRPDRKQGWGRIDLAAVLDSAVDVYLFDQQFVFTSTGQNWTEEFKPQDASKPMRIMLVWTDAPGAGFGGNSVALVNNLDLSAIVNGVRYNGNVIDPQSGMSAAGGQSDLINNVEGIFLSADQHSGNEVQIEILAANIAGDALDPYDEIIGTLLRQDFALACYNCQDPDILFKNGFE